MTSVPVMSDGIRSGVNWMRLKASDRHLASVRDHQRLGQAGHAFEDAVAAAEQRDQQLLDDLVLADDDAASCCLMSLKPSRSLRTASRSSWRRSSRPERSRSRHG